jgi:hypothetical protein
MRLMKTHSPKKHSFLAAATAVATVAGGVALFAQ